MKLSLLFAVPALLTVSTLARAETDPRDYALILAPNNTNVFLTYARHDTANDPGASEGATNIVTNIGIFRYLHLYRWGDLVVSPVDVVVPVADAQIYGLTGPGTALSLSGLADPVYLPHVGYSIAEDDKTATYFAFSPYFHFPLGNYDTSKDTRFSFLSTGNHRWQFDEEVAVGQKLLGGTVFLEAVGAATFYTKNGDYVAPGPMGAPVAGSLSQAPTFSGTLHASANVTKELWFAASYYAFANGKQTFTPNGAPAGTDIDQPTEQALRLTASIRPAEPLQVLLQYQNDLAESKGYAIHRFVGVRVSYLF